MKRYVGMAVLLLACGFAMAWSAAPATAFFFENPLIGKPMPDFTLSTTQEGTANFDTYREGKKAIVYFWATWCPSCQKELPHIISQLKTYEDQGIQFIFVNLGESKTQVKKFLKKHSVDANVWLDQKSAVAEELGVYALPTFFFINEEGKVKEVIHSLPEDYLDLFS